MVTDTIYVLSPQQTEAVLAILGLISFRKDMTCIVLVKHYATDVHASNQAIDITFNMA